MTGNKVKSQPAGVGMTPSKTELGAFIRARRLALDLRQASLAKRSGLRQSIVSLLEIGTRTYLCEKQMERLANTLRCDVEELRKRMPVRHLAQPKTELGKLIRSRREALGLSLPAFAKKLGIPLEKAKKLEVGTQQTIHYEKAMTVARALNLKPSKLAKFMGANQKASESDLGQLIRTRRKALGMSPKALAEQLEVSRQFVSQVELGRSSLSESGDMIARLAQVLQLDVEELEAVRPRRKRKQMESPNPLAGFLAEERVRLGLTMREVSKLGGISQGTISTVERGLSRPSPAVLDRFARALQCQIPPELARLSRGQGRR